MLRTIFRTEDLPVEDRFDCFHQMVRSTIFPATLQADQVKDFQSTVCAMDLGSAHVMQTTVSSTRASRSMRLVRQSDPEHAHLILILRGTYGFTIGDKETTLGKGDLFFYDSPHPFDIWAGDDERASGACTQVQFRFPRVLLPNPQLVDQILGARLVPRGGLRTLLSNHLRELMNPAADYRPTDAPGLVTTTLDLVTTLLAHELDSAESLTGETRQRALLTQVRHFVDEHLGDPDLSPGTIAAAHFISVRYLHKLFQDQRTTVASWIRRRRLERCHRDLIDPHLHARTINAIAARWGFTDNAHFSRLFRGTYGISPSDYRQLHRQATSLPSTTKPVPR